MNDLPPPPDQGPKPDMGDGGVAPPVTKGLCLKDNWCWVNPLPQGQSLKKLWARSSTEVYAVGEFGTFLMWDGKAWTQLDAGTEDNLYGLHGNKSTLYLVGPAGFMASCAGGKCTKVNTYATEPLNDVWVDNAGTAYAVGDNSQIVVFSFGWPASSKPTTKNLAAVWGADSKNIFAVGESGTILRYDGASWKAMTSPTTQHLVDVHGSSASDVWAVGHKGTLLHYDGSSWKSMSFATKYHLTTVWAAGPKKAFAVGSGNLYLAWDGSKWSSGSPAPGTSLSHIHGTSGGQMFAVQGSKVFHFNGAAWQPLTSSITNAYLTGIWGTSPSDFYAVGNGGTIVRRKGTTWSETKTGNNEQFGTIGGHANALFATALVGSKGQLLQWDGKAFKQYPHCTISNLGYKATDPEQVRIVGMAGGWVLFSAFGSKVYVLNPNSCTSILSLQQGGAWGSSPSNIFANQSGLQHFDGQKWTKVSATKLGTLRNIWGFGTKVLVGNSTTNLHACTNGPCQTSSATWTLLNGSWAKDPVQSIYGSTASDITAVTQWGQVLRFDGKSWQVNKVTKKTLKGVWTHPTGGSYIVGSNGVILHRAP